AEWDRFDGKRLLEDPVERRLERNARKRAKFAIAFAFELGNFDDELVTDVELCVNVDLRARKKLFRLNVNVGCDGTSAPRAHEETNLLEFDSVQTGFIACDANDCPFQLE